MTDLPELLHPEPELVAQLREGVDQHKRNNASRDGLQRALRALYGPPPTEDELAEARSLVAAQKARDFGNGGLFE